jgi:hypothetical protein
MFFNQVLFLQMIVNMLTKVSCFMFSFKNPAETKPADHRKRGATYTGSSQIGIFPCLICVTPAGNRGRSQDSVPEGKTHGSPPGTA